MAMILREFDIDASPDDAWAALREVGRVNELITFLGEVSIDGDTRTCELGDQGQLEELIVSAADEHRRLAYSITASPFEFEHHHASMQILPNGGQGSRFVWFSDVKPDGVAPALEQAVDAAVESFKQTLR
ncbi:MAG: SRPBCC family protein [Gemmatimonadota bacterium]